MQGDALQNTGQAYLEDAGIWSRLPLSAQAISSHWVVVELLCRELEEGACFALLSPSQKPGAGFPSRLRKVKPPQGFGSSCRLLVGPARHARQALLFDCTHFRLQVNCICCWQIIFYSDTLAVKFLSLLEGYRV